MTELTTDLASASGGGCWLDQEAGWYGVLCYGRCYSRGNCRSSSRSGEDERWSIVNNNVDSTTTLNNSVLLNEGANDDREVNDSSSLEDVDHVAVRSWCNCGDGSVCGSCSTSCDGNNLGRSIVDDNGHTTDVVDDSVLLNEGVD